MTILIVSDIEDTIEGLCEELPKVQKIPRIKELESLLLVGEFRIRRHKRIHDTKIYDKDGWFIVN